jgi:hypothetical protein
MALWTLWFEKKEFVDGKWSALYRDQSGYARGNFTFDTEEEADEFIEGHRRYYVETSKGKVQMQLFSNY